MKHTFITFGKLFYSMGILLFIGLWTDLISQDYNKHIFLDDIIYEYADYLVTSDRIHLDYPLQQPYNYDQLFDGVGDDPYLIYFKEFWDLVYPTSDKYILGLHVGNTLKNGSEHSSYRLESLIGYVHENFSAYNRIRVYEKFKDDPLFAGDLSNSTNWLFGRVNDAYVDYQSGFNHIFVGKMAHNWGPIASKSLILSDHAYTYNKILYNYSTPRVQLSLLFSQLESSSGLVYNFYRDTTSYISNANKFITGHRLDLNISDRLKIAFTEMAIYGGPNRQVELEFLNPMEFYYASQRNEGATMSGLWATDIYWRLPKRSLIYVQLLLDDIIVNNVPGVDDRSRFPDRLGFYFSLRGADYLKVGSLIDLSCTRIWNRTYQTYSYWENYHFRGKSLGYPFVSSEEIKLRSQYWGNYPHFFSSELTIGRYGAADVTDMFYLVKEEFPVEPVTKTIEHHLRYGWFKKTQLKIFMNHIFRYEKIGQEYRTFNRISLDIDYTFLK
jgi:hypothetical protein